MGWRRLVEAIVLCCTLIFLISIVTTTFIGISDKRFEPWISLFTVLAPVGLATAYLLNGLKQKR